MSTTIDEIFLLDSNEINREEKSNNHIDLSSIPSHQQLKFLKNLFFNYDETLSRRLNSFLLLFEKDKLEAQEIITDLCSIYYYTPTILIKETMIELIQLSQLDPSVKFPLSCAIFNYPNSKLDSYPLFIKILEDLLHDEKQLNITLFFDILKILLNKSNQFYSLLINDYKITNLLESILKLKYDKYFIYSTFFTLYKTNEYYVNFIYYFFYQMFFTVIDDDLKLKILIGSFFINKEEKDIESLKELKYKDEIIKDYKELILEIKEQLKQICINKENKYNIRADASDVLLNVIEKEYQEIGQKTIKELSGVDVKRNFYENKQNIHEVKVDESIKEFIHHLTSKQSLVIIRGTEEKLYKEVEDKLSIIDNDINILNSLNRIYLDTKSYEGFSLLTIFLKMWLYIQNHSNKNELLKRLIEELKEMSDTCSTGHIIRLVNVFSGLDQNIEVKYDIKLIMRNKILHLIHKKIDFEKDEIQDKVINDLDNKEKEVNEFNAYVMKNLVEIKEQIYEEFKESIKDIDEFEEIFREEVKELKMA